MHVGYCFFCREEVSVVITVVCMDLVLSLPLLSASFASGAAQMGWHFEDASKLHLVVSVLRFSSFGGNLSGLA